MGFEVSADAYAAFMGRFSEPLAEGFADYAAPAPGGTVLDVGCGPGALTARLVERLGAASVTAVDPSKAFVAAVAERFPDIEVREGVAEALPFDDDTFDAALAQLVVHFMSDPVQGLREMARVTRPGGVVATCVWDHGGAGGPLSLFWRAVQDVDPAAPGEARLPGARQGHLLELGRAAGLDEVEDGALTVEVGFASFDDWWTPYSFGVGPAGAYVTGLDPELRERLRARCEELLPPAPFTVTATAWTMRGRV